MALCWFCSKVVHIMSQRRPSRLLLLPRRKRKYSHIYLCFLEASSLPLWRLLHCHSSLFSVALALLLYTWIAVFKYRYTWLLFGISLLLMQHAWNTSLLSILYTHFRFSTLLKNFNAALCKERAIHLVFNTKTCWHANFI